MSNRNVIPIPLPGGGVATLDVPAGMGKDDYDWLVDLISKLERSIRKPPLMPYPPATSGTPGLHSCEHPTKVFDERLKGWVCSRCRLFLHE